MTHTTLTCKLFYLLNQYHRSCRLYSQLVEARFEPKGWLRTGNEEMLGLLRDEDSRVYAVSRSDNDFKCTTERSSCRSRRCNGFGKLIALT